ncbi:MAG: branched-chain amino acid ABC transporter permease [Ardenticatenaceae bacterium]|nr:branched-chain amino acid ABC transporter permease [Ardenticatenaceae bacterium]HBY94304.1 branched-chain amino acid ABC transporter permease [Chloroflexota bacterium]
MSRLSRETLGLLAFILVVAALPLAVRSPYLLSILIFIGLHAILTIGLALLMGYAGQISLGHAGFYGLGAYISAILTATYGINPWLALVAAAFLTTAFAFVVSGPILRLKGHYLAMATLALGLILYIAFNELIQLTGGPSGLSGIPYLSVAGFTFNRDVEYYYVVWTATLAILVVSLNIVNSRPGRALRALHASEVAAETLGVDTARSKVLVFTLSALYASLAGSLYAHYLTFVNPAPFGFQLSIELVVMAVVGGLASVWGAVFGAAIITALAQVIQAVLPHLLGRSGGEIEIVAFGLILMVVMIFMPEGVGVTVMRGLQRFAPAKERSETAVAQRTGESL